jgi:hypothetical protein
MRRKTRRSRGIGGWRRKSRRRLIRWMGRKGGGEGVNG